MVATLTTEFLTSKLMIETYVERHSLKFKATDQAAVFVYLPVNQGSLILDC